jgi:cytochrome c peroxidase
MNRFLFAVILATLPMFIGYEVRYGADDRRRSTAAIIEHVTRRAERQARSFRDHAARIEDADSVKGLMETYELLRLSYKAMEPLIEHVDPSLVSMFLNGAPLPKLDAKSQFLDVLEPHGLQVIDEMIGQAADTVLGNKTELIEEADDLLSNIASAGALLRSTLWTDRLILESARTGVMRLSMMGLSNFDRPGTEPSLLDQRPILQTIRALMMTFHGDCVRSNITAVHDDILRHIDGALTELLTPDSVIDKVELIRRYLDPLYGDVARLQLSLGIELSTEAGPAQPVVNPTAESMFTSNTLMPASSSGLHYKSITPALVDLGRTLFFDPVLSSNNQRACASCHDPNKTFTDGLKQGMAIDHQGSLKRNTPTVLNAVFSRRFFYDLRAMRISDVVSHVITDEQEFHSTLVDVVGRLRQSDEYVQLFEQVTGAKGASAIDATNVSLALAAYLTSLVSFNSPMDRYLRGESVTISASERRGFHLFMGKAVCATCHFPPTYAGYVPPAFLESESEVIGVPLRADTANAIADPDVGRSGGIMRENSPIYRGSFKTPTLRNVALTSPYFHNGSYTTLSQVVDFYHRGGGAGIGIDLPHQTLPFDRLDLTQQDAQDLVAFMEALTDTSLKIVVPTRLPRFVSDKLNKRRIGGEY